MDTQQVIHNDLCDRIARMERYLSISKALLKRRNYLQCAVRLELAAQQARFDELTMRLLESATIED